jgi:uncharacterized membrane protein YphA (DoxX/SURF4 family)
LREVAAKSPAERFACDTAGKQSQHSAAQSQSRRRATHETAAASRNLPCRTASLTGFSYAIPFLEAILGLTLILGVFTRVSLICGAIFMMALTVGVAANQQWDVAGQQLVYSVVFFLLLYLIEDNALALDNYLRSSPFRA